MPPTLATLKPGQLETLRALAKLGSTGATVSDLATILQGSRGTVGSQLDRLQAATLAYPEHVPGKPARWYAVDGVRYLVNGRHVKR